MKILLIMSPFQDFYATPHRLSALGLHAVEILCKQAGFITKTILAAQENGRSAHLPAALNYLKPFILAGESGPASFFKQYKSYGSIDALAKTAAKSGADFIFVSCFAYAYAQGALDFASALRALKPQAYLAIGGGGPSALPETFLDGGYNAALKGEAEEILPAFLARLKAGERPNGLIQASQPGQTQPLPLMRPILSPKEKQGYALSFLRGCRRQCRFCSQFLTHGRAFRQADKTKIWRLLETLPPSAEPVYFNFEDDNLLDAWDLWIEIMRFLKSRLPQAAFGAENGLNYAQLSSYRLEVLLELGFAGFNLSLAAANLKSAWNQARFYQPQQLEQVLNRLHEANVPATVYFIAGLENSLPQESAEALKYLYSLPCRIGISPFYAVPGLEGFEAKRVRQMPPVLFCASSLYPWNKSHTTGQLATLFRLSRTLNFFKFQQQQNELLAQRILNTKQLWTICNKQLAAVPMADYDLTANVLNIL